MAFNNISRFDHLSDITLTDCLPAKRTQEKMGMDCPLRRPHRDRSRLCSPASENRTHNGDGRYGCAADAMAAGSFLAKHMRVIQASPSLSHTRLRELLTVFYL